MIVDKKEIKNKLLEIIEDNEKVLDVGCDQAHLSELLAKRKIYSIASDLRENIRNRSGEKMSATGM